MLDGLSPLPAFVTRSGVCEGIARDALSPHVKEDAHINGNGFRPSTLGGNNIMHVI